MNEPTQHQGESIEDEIKRSKRKDTLARILEIFNYVILPIQYLTKDIFLLFSSYNAALDLVLPGLRFLSKSLSWVYGVSFILEGTCALIEATRSENEDKRLFLLGQGLFLILGGLALTAIVFTNPQIFLPLLCVVWGASTILFLYDITRDYLQSSKHLKHQHATLASTKELLPLSLSPNSQILPEDNPAFLNDLLIAFNTAIRQHGFDDVDTLELRAEIMEKIAIIQDQHGFATPEDIDAILQDMLHDEKYQAGMNSTLLMSAAYICLSFLCAVATFAFLGKSDLQQTVIFSHLLITAGMIAHRAYTFLTTPILFNAQFASISSRDIDQLRLSDLQAKYLKKRLKKLDKKLRRLSIKPDIIKLQKIMQEYTAIVRDINDKDSPYTMFLEDLSQSMVNGHKDDELAQLTTALQQSISSRLIYLGSNHACVLCAAMRELARKQFIDNDLMDHVEASELGSFHDAMTPEELHLLDAHRDQGLVYSLEAVNLECGRLLRKKSGDIAILEKSRPTSSEESLPENAPLDALSPHNPKPSSPKHTPKHHK